ncbi:MAG: tail fiber domain-containing protein, partial [Bacteroidales bacterium]|nr:tail fiber domain-containing protein [Bacteroidales bacterium]
LGSRALVDANNAVAIGYRAYANTANTVILGGINGVNGATSNSRVGIGTTDPSEALEVNGNVILNNNNIEGARMIWRGGTGGDLEYRARVTENGLLSFFPIESGSPGYIGEVLVLSPIGNVGISTNTPQARLHVIGSSSQTSIILATNNNSYQTDWPGGWGGGLSTWDINCASIQASSYVTRSDMRYKKDIQNLSFSALERIAQVRPVSYQYVDTLEESGLKGQYHYGFIAQEFEKVFPQLVGENVNGYKHLNYVEMIPVLTKAVQELMQENEILKKQNKEILEKLDKLINK